MTIADSAQRTAGVPSPGPSHISVWEAADALGLMPYEVYELCSAGLIAHTDWNGIRRVEVASLRDYAPRLGRTIP